MVGLMTEFLALVPEASALVCLQIGIFGPCLAATRAWWPSHEDQWSLADTIASVVLYPLLMWSAFRGTLELRHDVELRWRGTTAASQLFQILYVTRCILHIGVLFMQRMSRRDLWLMCLHHLLSVACFGGALLTRNCHYWACLNGCCEVTNVFLNNVWLFKEISINGLRLQQHLPRLYVANGFLLWLSYVVFRLLLFPYWLYSWHADLTSAAELTWERISNYERYLYVCVTVFLLLLSLGWFVPITSGLLKALSQSKEPQKAEDAKHK